MGKLGRKRSEQPGNVGRPLGPRNALLTRSFVTPSNIFFPFFNLIGLLPRNIATNNGPGSLRVCMTRTERSCTVPVLMFPCGLGLSCERIDLRTACGRAGRLGNGIPVPHTGKNEARTIWRRPRRFCRWRSQTSTELNHPRFSNVRDSTLLDPTQIVTRSEQIVTRSVGLATCVASAHQLLLQRTGDADDDLESVGAVAWSAG